MSGRGRGTKTDQAKTERSYEPILLTRRVGSPYAISGELALDSLNPSVA